MRRFVFAASLAATLSVAMAPAAIAQGPSDQQRWEAAQDRFDRELNIYKSEWDRYQSLRRSGRGWSGGGYGQQGYAPPQQGYAPRYADDRDEGGWDAARYYRDGSGYQERRLSANDRVYRGSDGRYYCRRNDGTTGLIVGGAAGGVLGNVIDGGHSRTVGTLIGAAVGALAGKTVDQQSQDVRCR